MKIIHHYTDGATDQITDGVVQRSTGLDVPNDDRLPLIGDADGDDVFHVDVQLPQIVESHLIVGRSSSNKLATRITETDSLRCTRVWRATPAWGLARPIPLGDDRIPRESGGTSTSPKCRRRTPENAADGHERRRGEKRDIRTVALAAFVGCSSATTRGPQRAIPKGVRRPRPASAHLPLRCV